MTILNPALIKKFVAVLSFSFIVSVILLQPALGADPVYKDPNAGVDARVADLLGRLTLEEKLLLVHGDEATGFDSAAIPRLNIPQLSMSDGPHGVRWGNATAFPTGVALGATWSEEMLEKMGVALGQETLAKGRNVILGPCINIHRQPFGGRNFESFSEDPYLAGRLAVAYVNGVQSQHAVATAKHYAVNNQEVERMKVSAEISERALREIYLPHFRMSVQDSGVLAIMCSYNKLNGIYACENKHLLTEILKDEWGFEGLVMSDWGAVHSTDATALSGMDIEMPRGDYLGEDLVESVKAGRVPESQIDEMVRRILRVLIVSGIYDGKAVAGDDWLESQAHRDVALDIARETITLLKNENNLLPLDRNSIKTLAVIGPGAAVPHLGGGGSSQVTPTYFVTPLEGIRAKAGSNVEVKYVMGCETSATIPIELIPENELAPENAKPGETGLKAEYYKGDFEGAPVMEQIEMGVNQNWGATGDPAEGLKRDNFSVRWSGTLTPEESGKYKIVLIAIDGSAKLYVNGKAFANVYSLSGNSVDKAQMISLEAGQEYKLKLEFRGTGVRASVKLGWLQKGASPIDKAARLAAESDAAVVFLTLDRGIEGEGNDRETLALPGLQDMLAAKVLAAQPNTIVVLNNGTPLQMDKWLDSANALIEAWYPGQEGGTAIAEVLFGDVNPSGHMPMSFPVSWEKSPAYPDYPGSDEKVKYSEDILVGYRWHDTKEVDPLFPFGFGLSYTTFEYANMAAKVESADSADPRVNVSVDITNSGDVPGKAVVQLYVRDEKSSVIRPEQELKGFKKVLLQPGETKAVKFMLDKNAFSYFDEKSMKWVVEPGVFRIRVGESSREIRSFLDVELK